MHNTYHYIPILTESTKNTFFDYINAIKLTPIDYFAVGVENDAKKQFTSLISRPDWQEYIHKKQFADKDPLIKAKIFSRRRLVPFSEIDHIDSVGREIMKQRAAHEIKDGLMLIQKKGQLKYMVMLATGFSKFDYFTFLKKYYSKLDRLKHDLTKIIERDIHQFFQDD
jgi:hypothetical protein